MAESHGQVPRRLEQLQRMFLPIIDDTVLKTDNIDVVPTNALQQQMMVPAIAEEEDVPYPLTGEEALHFLENILMIPHPLELLEKDPLEFLNVFLLQMNSNMPFTNIPITGRIFDKDYSPSFEEGKMAMFARQGGNCLVINLFTKSILDLLGYKACHIGANNPGDRTFDTHVSTVIYDLTYPGSIHLVDPGMVRPFYEPIHLDFDKESKIYQFSYLKCKLFKEDHGLLHLCSFIPEAQTAPSSTVIESEGTFWKILITYRPTIKRSRAYFYEKMKERIGFPSIIPEIFRSIAVFTRKDGRNFMLGHQDDLFVLKYMHDEDPSQFQALSKEEFLNFIDKELPQFPRSLVEKAIENLKYFKKLNGI